jgi:hypothetical protein
MTPFYYITYCGNPVLYRGFNAWEVWPPPNEDEYNVTHFRTRALAQRVLKGMTNLHSKAHCDKFKIERFPCT